MELLEHIIHALVIEGSVVLFVYFVKENIKLFKQWCV